MEPVGKSYLIRLESFQISIAISNTEFAVFGVSYLGLQFYNPRYVPEYKKHNCFLCVFNVVSVKIIFIFFHLFYTVLCDQNTVLYNLKNGGYIKRQFCFMLNSVLNNCFQKTILSIVKMGLCFFAVALRQRFNGSESLESRHIFSVHSYINV